MASILTVANVHFDTSGFTRLEQLGSDGILRINSKAIKVAAGPTDYRPASGEIGLIRYDTALNAFQFYGPSGWANVATTIDVTSADSGQNNYLRSIIAGSNLYWQTTMAAANVVSELAYNKANAANVLAFAALPNTTVTLQGSLTTTGNVKSSSDVSDSKGDVRVIPRNSQTSGYTLQTSDIGKFVSITTGGIIVPANIFNPGDAISIYNNSGSSQSITTSSVTCYLGGTSTSASPRTLAQRGIATVLCVGSNEFVITGSGLS